MHPEKRTEKEILLDKYYEYIVVQFETAIFPQFGDNPNINNLDNSEIVDFFLLDKKECCNFDCFDENNVYNPYKASLEYYFNFYPSLEKVYAIFGETKGCVTVERTIYHPGVKTKNRAI